MAALYDAPPGTELWLPVEGKPSRFASTIGSTAQRMGIRIEQRRFLAVSEATSDFGVERPAETAQVVRVTKL